MWTELSDTAILEKIGARLKTRRISRGLKQQELAEESGVGVSTIAKIESGQSVAFSLLISVMRTLDLLENLDLLVPEQKPSPMELLRTQGKKVKRVRNKFVPILQYIRQSKYHAGSPPKYNISLIDTFIPISLASSYNVLSSPRLVIA